MRELLLDLYYAAVRAADPAAAVRRELAANPLPSTAPVHVVAVGKAAHGMARGATAALREAQLPLAGGLIVAGAPDGRGTALPSLVGDHPVPGPASALAATAVAQAAAAIPATHQALVLISGGTSSLAAAPVDAVSNSDLVTVWETLLGSGADIRTMNAVRKRCLRWGAGRLAAALAPRPVRVLCISDVIGDDPGTIGSGPCAPDPLHAREVLGLLEPAIGTRELPATVRRLLERQASGELPDTLKPGDAAFRNVTTHVVASNRLAVQAVARRAEQLGHTVLAGASDLAGEARDAGARIGAFLRSGGGGASCFVWGGETTVTLGGQTPGLGGRCQELALAAAEELDGVPGVALLAAGTDGRDGPTDAAGALVDGATWSRMIAQGRNPARDLAVHDAFAGLESAEALLRTGPTGTNVMDVVIGVRRQGDTPPARK